MGFHSLAIGTSALLTARYGLDVTGQNLGNVDTAGYSRQRVNQEATLGWNSGLSNAVIGTGVWTSSVKRIGSEYVEKQLRQATTTDEYYGSLQNTYSHLQSYVNELSGNALSDSMTNFWSAMTDFSTQVENIAIRRTTVTQAEQMTGRFNALGEQLAGYRKDLDTEVKDSVTQINRILGGIAELNKQIVHTELGGASNISANDLRDQRGELAKELYKYMDADIVEEDNGSYIVSIHGRSLVYFDQAKEVVNQKTLSKDGTMVNMPVFAKDKYPLSPANGLLAAQMEARDSIIPSYQDELNNLAANFIWEFNRAYSQSRGLESFTSLTSLNGPTNPEATLDQLKYADNVPAGTFEIKNGVFQIIVHNRNSDQPTTVPIEVDLDGRPSPLGEPDMILYDPSNPDASHSLINRMQKALDEAAPGVFEVSIDRHNQVSITSKSDDYGFCFGEDTSGVLAALGMNVFFTGHDATSMGVNQSLKANPELIAGATSFSKGDNNGALNLLKVREKELSTLKSSTLEGYYQGMTGRLGSEASSAKNMKNLSCDVLNRMFVQRESLSGVNEDEEVSKLITYQRAFQSAAKFISTVDQLYETLINM